MSCAARLVGDGPLRPVDPAEAAAYKGKGFVWVHIDGGDQADLATLRRYDEMPDIAANALVRSEEHTSELQSLMRISYAGFCLKKKNRTRLNAAQKKNDHTNTA